MRYWYMVLDNCDIAFCVSGKKQAISEYATMNIPSRRIRLFSNKEMLPLSIIGIDGCGRCKDYVKIDGAFKMNDSMELIKRSK